MKSISPKAHFRQRVIKYSAKNGVTATSIRYRISRKNIYDCEDRVRTGDGARQGVRTGDGSLS